MTEQNVVHLHVHTGYSINDGLSKIEKLVLRAKALGMKALAVTEHGNMFSAVYFYKMCKKHGIKPIIGCEMYVCPTGHKDKVRDNRHLVLLAKDEIGYKNMVKILSHANKHGFYYNPRTDYEFLKSHSKGIVALSACLGGDVSKTYHNTLNATENEEMAWNDAVKKIEIYTDIFGKDDYYLEVQDNGVEDQYKFNEVIYRLAEHCGVKVVCTNDVHYVTKEEYLHHDVLMAVQAGTTVTNTNRKRYESDQFYLKSFDEMNTGGVPLESILMTNEIADKCNFDFDFGNYHIPVYDYPRVYADSESYLRTLVYSGMKERYPDFEERRAELSERADFELSVIKKMGFNDYFLITWDLIKYAKDNGVAIGPGRGSAGGSIVSYALRITDVEPIRFNLLFERFLNPDRISMPDYLIVA